MDDLLSLICNCSTTADMAFELVNTIDRAWRTVEDEDFLSCKTVCLYYDDLYNWTEALDIAYEKIHPGCSLPVTLKDASHELHSLCRARDDERRFRIMVAAADDMQRTTIAAAALAALSVPVSAGVALNPWVHNAHFGPPQDVVRYYRELAPITIPAKRLKMSGKYSTPSLRGNPKRKCPGTNSSSSKLQKKQALCQDILFS